MSYDISFKVRVADTDKFVTVGNCDANITWNVRKIIELSTGLPWLNEENNGYCVDITDTDRTKHRVATIALGSTQVFATRCY